MDPKQKFAAKINKMIQMQVLSWGASGGRDCVLPAVDHYRREINLMFNLWESVMPEAEKMAAEMRA